MATPLLPVPIMNIIVGLAIAIGLFLALEWIRVQVDKLGECHDVVDVVLGEESNHYFGDPLVDRVNTLEIDQSDLRSRVKSLETRFDEVDR